MTRHRYLVRKRSGRWEIVNRATGRATRMPWLFTLPLTFDRACAWSRTPPPATRR